VKSKAKFLPLVLFAAVLVSLVFIMPVFSATGTVRFVDPDDTTLSQAWARQGGNIQLEVTDSDLSVPVKHVLLPADMTDNAATAAVTAGSSLITMSSTSTALATATTTASLIALDDTILIGSETVRKVTAVNMATGVVTVNKAFTVTASAATVAKVTATDGSAASCPNCARAQAVTTATGAATKFFVLNSVPLADSGAATFANRFVGSSDTVVNVGDVGFVDDSGTAVAASLISLTAITAANGLVTALQSTSTAQTFNVVYWGSSANDTGSSVTIVSQADTTGINVALTETGPTTGIFRLTILATSSDSDVTASPPQIKVGTSDVVTLKYTDASPSATVSKTVTVETTNPVFSNQTPANATAGKDSRPDVEADVTDADSGISKATVKVIFGMDTDNDGDIETATEVDVGTEGDRTAITAGYHAKLRLPSTLAPSTDATIYWWVKGSDVAGNPGVSDRVATIDSAADACVPSDFPAVAGLVGVDPTLTTAAALTAIASCQPFSIKVDFSKPTVASAETGPWWDTTKTTADKTETDVTKAKNTSILVKFNENIDITTIQVSDFEVDGIAPLTADAFSGAQSSVFLGIASILADARPKVELVGEVKDVAGNVQTTGTVTNAADKIAPTLTVTVTGTGASRPVSTKTTTITIVSDEDVGQPSVYIRKVGDELLTNPFTSAVTSTPVAVLKSSRTYEATFDTTTAGLYNVYVTGKDATAQNEGTTGVTGGAALDVSSSSGALLFEVDTGVPAPTVTPASTDDVNAFIKISFAGEATEYSSTAATATDHDAHDTVTITAITLDGIDILASLATTDNKTFLYKASDLSDGSHTVKLTASDTAGNVLTDNSSTVKVTPRKAFSLALNPGWNMVSIPGEPAVADINTVIPATHPASTVLTYDPTVPGGWLIAIRDGDGNFAGTLAAINAGRAYWILTDSFEAITVDIPRLVSGAAVLPPTINIVVGWNFIPVLDVTGDLAAGATASTTAYLSGLSGVSRVWAFNTIDNKWQDHTTTTVAVGSGYWLYSSKAETLIP
jgi:hypothetical protein